MTMEPLRSRHEPFSRIAQIGILFSTEKHLPYLLGMIVREACAISSAEAGALYLKEGNSLKLSVFQYKDASEKPPGNTPKAPEGGEITSATLSGQALTENKIINIPNIRSCPEDYPAHLYSDTHYTNYSVQSLMVIPLIGSQQQKIGVLHLVNARSSDGSLMAFDAYLMDLLMPLATQAAIAILNVRWGMEIQRSFHDTLYRLALAAEYRDDPTGFHIQRIGLYSELIAQYLGLPSRQVDLIRAASPLHDIGKIAIPETILLKPGKLSPEEFATIKKHTTVGALILDHAESEILQMAEKIARTHHEKFDGSGYPDGLRGADIPLEGRIVAVADAFDAITTSRPYKVPIGVEQAVDLMKRDSGKHFDPDCLMAFEKALPKIQKIFQTLQGPPASTAKSQFEWNMPSGPGSDNLAK
jgi:HD-GYP domain-containing protein (c-di-GMP phosphodiesterase class II)